MTSEALLDRKKTTDSAPGNCSREWSEGEEKQLGGQGRSRRSAKVVQREAGREGGKKGRLRESFVKGDSEEKGGSSWREKKGKPA